MRLLAQRRRLRPFAKICPIRTEQVGMSMIATGLLEDLRTALGDRVTDAAEIRAAHGLDVVSSYPVTPPDVVVFPDSSDEVRAVVDLCRRYRTPIIPYGAGTAVEGQVLAVRGGVCID